MVAGRDEEGVSEPVAEHEGVCEVERAHRGVGEGATVSASHVGETHWASSWPVNLLEGRDEGGSGCRASEADRMEWHSLVSAQKLGRDGRCSSRLDRPDEHSTVRLGFPDAAHHRQLFRCSAREAAAKTLPAPHLETDRQTHLDRVVSQEGDDTGIGLVPTASLGEEDDGRRRLACVRGGNLRRRGSHLRAVLEMCDALCASDALAASIAWETVQEGEGMSSRRRRGVAEQARPVFRGR